MSWLAYTCELSHFLSEFAIYSSPRTSWEFILNLGHDYSIVMGKRKFIHTYPVGSSHAARAKDLIPRGTALHGVSLVHPIHHHITVRVP